MDYFVPVRAFIHLYEWKTFVIDTLINRLYSRPKSINNGWVCLAAVSDPFTRKAKLPRIKVSTRKLLKSTGYDKGDFEMMTEMTEIEIDVDGYQRSVNAYIIPRLPYELILGKP